MAAELIRVTIMTEAALGSALRIWTNHVHGAEPSYVETDDDGDTFARGFIGAAWLEIMRAADHLIISYTANEKDRNYNPIELIVDEDAVAKHATELASSLCSGISFSGISIEVVYTDLVDSAEKTIDLLRENLPEVPFPDGLRDGNYKISVVRPIACEPSQTMVIHANWRNGRRFYTIDDDETPRIYVDSFGTTVNVGFSQDADEGKSLPTTAMISELFPKVRAVKSGGLRGI